MGAVSRGETPVAQISGDLGQVSQALSEIRDIMREDGLDRTLAIGKLVLERFFGGSPELWHDRRRNKNNSVRRLAELTDCPLSRSALNQAIGVYAAVCASPNIKALKYIGSSHISVVLPLPVTEQEEWLKRANEERWSVRRLMDELARNRNRGGEHPVRQRSTVAGKAFSRTHSALKTLEQAVERLSDIELHRLDEPELRAFSERATALQTKLSELCRLTRMDSQVVPAHGPGGDGLRDVG